MKPLVVLLSALTLVNVSFGQNITGIVKDQDQKPLEKSSVSLLKAKDSTLVKMDATDKNGKYAFVNIPDASYLVMATNVGYANAYSKPFTLNGEKIIVPEIIMEKTSTQLSVVTVTARKPLVEVKSDRMVVNVEGTINATGNDALELLRKSPGVLVDKDDNISMSGKNGVSIYIDGKPSPLSGSDLSNYLKSLQSSSIESIELITNPSAKYEAAGNAGIINIKLKKDKSMGTNGSITAGYNIGVLSKYNGGINLNHRTKKMNIFSNYNYSNYNWYNKQTLYRELADSIFNQHTKMTGNFTSHNVKAGVDYFLSKKSTVGILVNGNFTKSSFNSNGVMSIADIPTNTIDKYLKANTDLHSDRTNMNFNANYKYADTSGRELNVDADYGFYNLNNRQYIPNYYYALDGITETNRKIYRTNAPTNIDIYSIKADYEQKLGKGKLGYGGKIGFVETRNKFNRYEVIGMTDVYD
jgi:iron complex outermembrane recepter protein